MTNETITGRINALRTILRREKMGAFIFPSTDPHQGEYVPEHWKGREWISGFDGSAGTVVVTLHSAALWTDSRYFIAATEQLAGTGISLMRERISGTPSIAQWLGAELADEQFKEVGIDGMCLSLNDVEGLIADLRRSGGLTLRTNFDPLNELWTDRPSVPNAPVVLHPLEFAGDDTTFKLAQIRMELLQQHADGMLVCSLDDIAWTLNLRGEDVHCNPVFVSYLLITANSATLYINKEKLTAEVLAYLQSVNVGTKGYTDIKKDLGALPDYNILIDPNEVAYTLAKAVKGTEVVRGKSPIPVMKAIKNDAEIAGFRRAMLRDGVAMVRFLAWLNPAVERGGETELTVSDKLFALRSVQENFRGLSFDTISAYAEHGAIVHYEPTEETDKALESHGLLLLDSGAQYADGTTDITRTIALGPTTEEEKRIYTLVLKGHIQLEMAKFPAGAAGTQLDAIARAPLWRENLNFLHGTGHGVGSYLNVHEGPHQIRMEWKPTPLRAGMTVTDEPGIYLEHRFGVRHENTLIIKKTGESEFGEFLGFESLTLCPFDKAPLMVELLTTEERNWLNQYHQTVLEAILPHLDDEAEQQWLKDACAEL